MKTYSALLQVLEFEKELKPGTKVVMESFPVPGWKPSKIKETGGRTFFLYTMPPEKTDDYEKSQLTPKI